MIITPTRILPVMTAIDQDSAQEFRKISIRSLVQKLDRRLIPLIVILEISSFINRVTISFANRLGLQTYLNMSESESDWAISLFYIADLFFTIPSVWLTRLLGPSRYLSFSMITWGSLTVGMAFVKDAKDLLIVCFCHGVAISDYFPSIVLYFSLWYCKRDQMMRIAILTAAASASGAIDAFLIYGISKMDSIGSLHSWQWAFLLEGLPIIPIGIITYLFLSSVPETVHWLNGSERQLLTNYLRDDAGPINVESDKRFSWQQVYYAFIDWRIYLYAVIGIGNLGLIKCLTALVPRIVENMNLNTAGEYLMMAPPYAAASMCCLLSSYWSARRNEHSLHLIFCLLIDLLGFIFMIILFNNSTAGVYTGLCLSFCGTFSALPLLLSWLTNNIHGNTKRTTAIGFVMGVGQLGGVLTPLIYRNADKPSYQRGHIICDGMVAVSVIFVIILRICLMSENHRRKYLSPEQYTREAAIEEPCDWVFLLVFLTTVLF